MPGRAACVYMQRFEMNLLIQESIVAHKIIASSLNSESGKGLKSVKILHILKHAESKNNDSLWIEGKAHLVAVNFDLKGMNGGLI